jgi:hypothetical protein
VPRDIIKIPTVPTVKELLGKAYTEDYQTNYPDVVPPYHPVGTRILVQLRTPGSFKKLTNGKTLWYPDESVDAEKFRTQTALVRSMGPAAFRTRATMEPWPEGDWCVPGQFIRCPMYGGDRIAVPLKDEWNRDALFMTMNDSDVIGVIYGDPLTIKTLL